MVRRRRIKEMVDTKVITGESVAKRHRIVVSATIIWTKWRKAPKPSEDNKMVKAGRQESEEQIQNESD